MTAGVTLTPLFGTKSGESRHTAPRCAEAMYQVSRYGHGATRDFGEKAIVSVGFLTDSRLCFRLLIGLNECNKYSNIMRTESANGLARGWGHPRLGFKVLRPLFQ